MIILHALYPEALSRETPHTVPPPMTSTEAPLRREMEETKPPELILSLLVPKMEAFSTTPPLLTKT